MSCAVIQWSKNVMTITSRSPQGQGNVQCVIHYVAKPNTFIRALALSNGGLPQETRYRRKHWDFRGEGHVRSALYYVTQSDAITPPLTSARDSRAAERRYRGEKGRFWQKMLNKSFHCIMGRPSACIHNPLITIPGAGHPQRWYRDESHFLRCLRKSIF